MQFRRFLIQCFIFVVLIISAFANLYSQSAFIYGNPFVRYYHPLEYKGYSQNWYVTQDENGPLYFANGDGILEYDGHEWILHKVGNHLTPTSMLIGEEIFWVGAKSDFGYFIIKGPGEKEFISLKHFISEESRDFGFVTGIYEMNNLVYFCTSDKMFIWNGKNIQVANYGSGSGVYKASDYLILYNSEVGLQLVSGTKLLLISGGEFFAGKNVRAVIEYDMNRFLIVTRNNGMFVVSFDFSVIYAPRLIIETELQSEVYNRANSDIIYHCIRLSGGMFGLSTMLGGTYLMYPDGEFAGQLNRETKIPNETHTHLFEDKEGNLWIALDNGIAKVQLSGNFTYFDDISGLYGSVIDINFFNSKIFAGTWQGLYYLDMESFSQTGNRFNSFSSIKSQCWKLQVIFNDNVATLWAATSDGLFVIDEQMAEQQISEGLYYSILQLNSMPSFVFAGHREGVDIFKLENNKIQLHSTLSIPGQQSRIVSIEEDSDGVVWMGSEFLGVFSVHIHNTDEITEFQLIHHYDSMPFAEYYYVYKYFDKIYFVSREGVFHYLKSGNDYSFERVFYNPLLSFQQNYYVNIFYQDNFSGNAWLQMGLKNRALKYFGNVELKAGEIAYDFNSYKEFPGFEIYAMRADSSGYLWLGCDDGLFVLSNQQERKKTNVFRSIIRTIIVNNNETFYHGSLFNNMTDDVPRFQSNENNMIFVYTSNTFIDESKTQYRYKLDGFDETWSSWSESNNKEYTNLAPGTYVFKVEAKDVLDQVSQQSEFVFIILKPWYKTWVAFVSYIIVIAGLGLLINLYTNRRLIKAKMKLENIVEKRTKELQMQKKEVEVEKEKSDRLLLNILPVKVAEQLKSSGYSMAEHYDSATVLFTDFAGFTKIAERETSQELIDKLERFFILFDEIVIRNKLEKIKTIGDSHMSVGGVPVNNKTHVFDSVLAAIEMIEVMNKARLQQPWANEWHLRIGIHTGSLIAGIVGKRKFAYDVWGDTVNMSSRLQETGEKDRINISKEVYSIIEPFFECEARGKITVKHKGAVEMYFVNRLKSEYSKNQNGTKPNLAFRQMYWKL